MTAAMLMLPFGRHVCKVTHLKTQSLQSLFERSIRLLLVIYHPIGHYTVAMLRRSTLCHACMSPAHLCGACCFCRLTVARHKRVDVRPRTVQPR